MSTLAPSLSANLQDGNLVRIQKEASKIQASKHASTKNSGKIDEKAQEFEAVFLSQMLQHMFDGVETDENFGGGEGEDMVKSLLVDEYGKLIARTGGIGVADYVKREMLSLQEVK
jgi:peptidoglycan hydrolase FlgJ